jgi:hypothetical protein
MVISAAVAAFLCLTAYRMKSKNAAVAAMKTRPKSVFVFIAWMGAWLINIFDKMLHDTYRIEFFHHF